MTSGILFEQLNVVRNVFISFILLQYSLRSFSEHLESIRRSEPTMVSERPAVFSELLSGAMHSESVRHVWTSIF